MLPVLRSLLPDCVLYGAMQTANHDTALEQKELPKDARQQTSSVCMYAYMRLRVHQQVLARHV